MEVYSTMTGVIILPISYYFLKCRYNGIATKYIDCCIFLTAGMAFWYAQFLTDWLKILVLLLSLSLYGVITYRYYCKTHSFTYAINMIFIIGLLLPAISIGYNQYTITEGERIRKFDDYLYSQTGVLMIRNNDNEIGLRDRFNIILPCEYKFIKMKSDRDKPYISVYKDENWYIFNLETRELINRVDSIYN